MGPKEIVFIFDTLQFGFTQSQSIVRVSIARKNLPEDLVAGRAAVETLTGLLRSTFIRVLTLTAAEAFNHFHF